MYCAERQSITCSKLEATLFGSSAPQPGRYSALVPYVSEDDGATPALSTEGGCKKSPPPPLLGGEHFSQLGIEFEHFCPTNSHI